MDFQSGYLYRTSKEFTDKLNDFRKHGVVPQTLCPFEKKGKITLHVEVSRFLIKGDEYFDENSYEFYKLIPHPNGKLMEGTITNVVDKKVAFVLNDQNIFDVVWL